MPGTMPGMPELLDQPRAEQRAAARRDDSPTGIGAALWWDETRAGRDRCELRVIVTDADGCYATCLVALPVFEPADAGHIESWVERRAAAFPPTSRLRDLVAAARGSGLRMPAPAGAAAGALA